MWAEVTRTLGMSIVHDLLLFSIYWNSMTRPFITDTELVPISHEPVDMFQVQTIPMLTMAREG